MVEKLGAKYRVALLYASLRWMLSLFVMSSYHHRRFFAFKGKQELFVVLMRLSDSFVKDPRFERLPCTHKGTYADDCLVQRVTQVVMSIMTDCKKTEIRPHHRLTSRWPALAAYPLHMLLQAVHIHLQMPTLCRSILPRRPVCSDRHELRAQWSTFRN